MIQRLRVALGMDLKICEIFNEPVGIHIKSLYASHVLQIFPHIRVHMYTL